MTPRPCLYLSVDDLWVLKHSLTIAYEHKLSPGDFGDETKNAIKRLIDRCQVAIDRATEKEAS